MSTTIISKDGFLFISPVPPGLEEELRFWELVQKFKEFNFTDRETQERRSGMRRDGYKGQWSSLITVAHGTGCCTKGLLRRILNFMVVNGIPHSFEERRALAPFHFGPDVVAPFVLENGTAIQMRPEQIRALISILCEIGSGQEGAPGDGLVPPAAGSGGALLSATMSTGKTTIIAALIRCFPAVRVLVVTKKKSVIRRLRDGLTELLPEIAHEIGEFHGGKKDERRVTVCSEALLDSFDTTRVRLVIHDEVHNSSGTVVAGNLLAYDHAIKVGFSGTIERHPRLKFIESLFGPVVDTISDQEAEDLDRVSKMKVYVLKTHSGPDISGKKEHALERDGITHNHRRNRLAKDVCLAIPPEMQTIVFVRTIEHIDVLMEKHLPPGFVVYHGQLKDKERKDIEKRLCSGEITRLIANDALSEGVDTTHVRVILEWGWSTTDMTVSQRGGRGRRKTKGKRLGLIITPSDDWEIGTEMEGVEKENPLHAKRVSRVANYSRRGWPIIKVNEAEEIDFAEVNVDAMAGDDADN